MHEVFPLFSLFSGSVILSFKYSIPISDVNRVWVGIYKFAYFNNNGLFGIFFNVQMHI